MSKLVDRYRETEIKTYRHTDGKGDKQTGGQTLGYLSSLGPVAPANTV